MPVSLSAAKRQRQTKTRNLRNKSVRSTVRTSIKAFEASVAASDKGQAEKNFNSMVKLIDSASRKGIYHKNTAARKKSRMSRLLNSMEG